MKQVLKFGHFHSRDFPHSHSAQIKLVLAIKKFYVERLVLSSFAICLDLKTNVVRCLVNYDLLVHVSLLSLRWVHYLIFMSSYR